MTPYSFTRSLIKIHSLIHSLNHLLTRPLTHKVDHSYSFLWWEKRDVWYDLVTDARTATSTSASFVIYDL